MKQKLQQVGLRSLRLHQIQPVHSRSEIRCGMIGLIRPAVVVRPAPPTLVARTNVISHDYDHNAEKIIVYVEIRLMKIC